MGLKGSVINSVNKKNFILFRTGPLFVTDLTAKPNAHQLLVFSFPYFLAKNQSALLVRLRQTVLQMFVPEKERHPKDCHLVLCKITRLIQKGLSRLFLR